jgi:uncharacterized protein YifN (PemK superfamily)
LPSISPKPGENFGWTILIVALSLSFPNDFRNQWFKTEHLETFSRSRLNRNNSLGYLRTIIMPGIFHTHLNVGILLGAS